MTGRRSSLKPAKGNDSLTWRPVAGAMARFDRAVVYDRAGLGKSTPPVHPSEPVTADAGRQLSLLHCSDALENGRVVERGLQFSA